MFAYCLNNPVNYKDISGKEGLTIAVGGTLGAILTKALKVICVVAVLCLIVYVVDTISTTVNLRTITKKTAAEKADAAIRRKVKQKSKVRYWSATIKDGYVDIGRSLTYAQAVKEVKAGRSVFTVTWYEAKAVALAAGGDSGSNNHQLYPEIDSGKENVPGYYYHYHTYNRQGGHVYFLFGEA